VLRLQLQCFAPDKKLARCVQTLVDAIDQDKSGDISREEFDKGFAKVVAGLVRRGSIAGRWDDEEVKQRS